MRRGLSTTGSARAQRLAAMAVPETFAPASRSGKSEEEYEQFHHTVRGSTDRDADDVLPC